MQGLIYLKRKPIRCPSCDFRPLATILHKELVIDNNLKDRINRGLAIVKDCSKDEINPTWECSSCKKVFYKIKKTDTYIKFEINNYMEGWTEYKYINGEVSIFHSMQGTLNDIDINETALLEFKRFCIESNIFKWEKEYYNPHILDGTGWELELNLNGKYIQSDGINEYPKEFDKLQLLIEKIFN